MKDKKQQNPGPAASPRFHYAWIILAACCLMQSAITGVVQNGRGIFYVPVCTELGIETSAFTLYSLFHGIGSFLCLPLTARFYNRVHPRIALSLAAAVFCGTTALMGSFSTLPAFYTLGFLQGVGGSLLVFFVCPILINNWFKAHYGFAMGLYAAFSGLAGVVVNPLLSAVIESAGWRTGYRVQGLLAFALALPAALLIRSRQPEEAGLMRLGEQGAETRDPEKEAGRAAEEAAVTAAPATVLEKRILVWVLIFTLFSSVVNAYCQHIAKYASSIGLAPAVGALLVSCSMAGNIGSKFGIGALNDKIGAKKALLIGALAVILGFSGMILFAGTFLLYPAAVLSGVCMPLCSLCIPMLAKHLYPPARYRKFFPKVTMLTTLASSAGITVLSLLYEIWDSYVPVFLLGITFTVICVVSILASDRLKKSGEAGIEKTG